MQGGPSLVAQDLDRIRLLLKSDVALHRAEAARFLSFQDPDAAPLLAALVTADPSVLVRRESMLGLARLGASDEIAHLLRASPKTELDRSAWVVAAGQTGATLHFDLETPWLKLLRAAASEYRRMLPRRVPGSQMKNRRRSESR
jgi:hypothetical protein